MLSILENFINKLGFKQKKSEPESLKKNPDPEKKEAVILPDASFVNKDIEPVSLTKNKLTKNKIPIIEEHIDLKEYFTDKDDNLPKVVKKAKKQKKTKIQKTKKTPLPLKNGLPVLSSDEDLYKYFMDNEHNEPDSFSKNIKKNIKKNDKEDFEQMLEISLAGKTREMILIEKYNGVKADKTLNKKEIIKYYPLPQDELDLHGCTAAEALKENENFINKSRHKGKRTVLIIVGKGTGTNGKPVLPGVIENQLIEFKRKKIVLDYKWDRGIKRKSGALIVYLNE